MKSNSNTSKLKKGHCAQDLKENQNEQKADLFFLIAHLLRVTQLTLYISLEQSPVLFTYSEFLQSLEDVNTFEMGTIHSRASLVEY